MLIRRLVIACLIAGAASAQAGTIGSQSTQPANLVSGWTTGNGTDVLGSGVLQGGSLNLVAGVTHSADASLSDILYGKVSGSVEQVAGQTKLFFQRGIEANYLLASGHGILAATAGPGKSVVGDAYGAIISDGRTRTPGMVGGGNNSTGGGGSGSVGGSGSWGGGTGGGSSGSPGASPSTMPGPATDMPGQGVGVGNGGLNGNGGGIGAGGGIGNIGEIGNDLVAEVPEPSSIALMLLGMAGAGALSRRRRR